MKKLTIVALIFALLLGTVSLVGCTNNGGDDRINSTTGELGADAFKSFYGSAWNESVYEWNDNEDFVNSETGASYQELLNNLAQGKRTKRIVLRFQNLVALKDKQISKTSFTIVSDRDVTVVIAADYADGQAHYFTKTVSLKANEAQNITIDMNVDFSYDSSFSFELWQNDDKDNKYNNRTTEFGTWSQAVYKITNFKLYCN